MRRWALGFFFCSGMTGLVYQVLWTRRLTLTFGHTVLAVSTVLTAFMAGLALGSVVAGRWGDREAGPRGRFLRAYGWLEGFIGLWALLSLPLLGLVEDVYLQSTRYLVFFAGAMLVLVPPTAAMGATVPVLSRLLVGRPEEVGPVLSRLYGANTLGAVVGAALAGFVLLPQLGLQASMGLAAAVNLTLGVAALLLPAPDEVPRAGGGGRGPWVVPLCFGLAGAASMAFQVGWTRALALSIGSSVYAFSMILVVFLTGLGLGSLLYRVRRPELWHLGAVQLGIGALGAATIPLLGLLPLAFLRFFPGDSFAMVLALDGALVAALLLGPTLLMGLAFPLATALYARGLDRLGSSVGDVYGANTLGCIAGAFLTGFVLIPWLGVQATLQAASLCYLVTAVVLMGWRGRLAALLVGMAVVWLPGWDPAVMTAGVAVYQQERFVEPAFYRDGLSCTVSVDYSGTRKQHVSLRVNGKVDASLGPRDQRTQALIAWIPGFLHPAPRKVAVIGLGAGFTLEGFAQIPGVEQLDCVELEPAVVEAARYFEAHNGHVLEDPRVRLHLTDGRTFVLASRERFDVIASEPSNPWIAGVGNLFTRDFYEACLEHLAPGGIMAQWVNLYALSPEDLRMVLATFFAVFPEGQVWQTGPGDLLLVGAARKVSLDWERVQELWPYEEFYPLGLYRPEMLAGHYRFDRETAPTGGPLNTDDRPLLEFSAPTSLYDRTALSRNRELVESLAVDGEAAAGFGWLNVGDTRRVAQLLEREEAPLLAALLGAESDPEVARGWFAVADSPLATALQAEFELSQGRREEARRLATEALASPPPGSRRELLRILGDGSEGQEAVDAYLEGGWLTFAGWKLQELGRAEEARSVLERALSENPWDAWARELLTSWP